MSGDGQGVVIINEVTAEHADQISRRIQQLGASPDALTLEQLKQVLEFARTELKLGDMYNSTRDFVRSRMTPVLSNGADAAAANAVYGLKKRDDRDICYAVYVPGRFVFEGPAAMPQVFESGGVIVAQGGELRGVQPDVFVRTYRLADGRSISSVTADLKVHEAERYKLRLGTSRRARVLRHRDSSGGGAVRLHHHDLRNITRLLQRDRPSSSTPFVMS